MYPIRRHPGRFPTQLRLREKEAPGAPRDAHALKPWSQELLPHTLNWVESIPIWLFRNKNILEDFSPPLTNFSERRNKE